MFTEEIKRIVDHVDGGVGGLVMGLDGIAIDSYLKDGQTYDVDTLGMEFSFILGQVKKAGESLQIGGLNELALQAKNVTLLLRMLNDEYFLAVVLDQSTNLGKARFLSRIAASKLREQL